MRVLRRGGGGASSASMAGWSLVTSGVATGQASRRRPPQPAIGYLERVLLLPPWGADAGRTVIRSQAARLAARTLPVIGLAGLAAAAHYATGTVGEFRHGLLITAAAAALAVVAPVGLDQRGPVARMLAWGPLLWLGVISYGVYLWHWPVFLALNGQRTGWTRFPLFIVLCIATLAWPPHLGG